MVSRDDCWLYAGNLSTHGYGQISVYADGRQTSYKVYRLMYELEVGEIPLGHDIDHLCMVKQCINPSHLEPVTHRENINRYFLSKGSEKECRVGHPRTRTALYFNQKRNAWVKDCLDCRKIRETKKRKLQELGK